MKDEYDLSKAKRGAVVPPPENHTRVNMWVDDEVLAWFREQVNNAGGGDWQADMNDVLRQFIATKTSEHGNSDQDSVKQHLRALMTVLSEDTFEDKLRRNLHESRPVVKFGDK